VSLAVGFYLYAHGGGTRGLAGWMQDTAWNAPPFHHTRLPTTNSMNATMESHPTSFAFDAILSSQHRIVAGPIALGV
jgi:hypothetical protein